MSGPRRAWCAECGTVQIVDSQWRCTAWRGAGYCDAVTMGGGTRYTPIAATLASVRVVREAHRLHAEGLSVEAAARATITRTRYRDVRGYASTLRGSWALLGLPTRPASVSQALRARTESAETRERRIVRPRFRHDISTAELVAHYETTGSTLRTAEAFQMSQQGVHARLKPLGVIKRPCPRLSSR